MPPENRRTFVKKSVATSVSISFVGLIRAAHGEGGGQTTTWNPENTTSETTFSVTTTWNPDNTTVVTTEEVTTTAPPTTAQLEPCIRKQQPEGCDENGNCPILVQSISFGTILVRESKGGTPEQFETTYGAKVYWVMEAVLEIPKPVMEGIHIVPFKAVCFKCTAKSVKAYFKVTKTEGIGATALTTQIGIALNKRLQIAFNAQAPDSNFVPAPDLVNGVSGEAVEHYQNHPQIHTTYGGARSTVANQPLRVKLDATIEPEDDSDLKKITWEFSAISGPTLTDGLKAAMKSEVETEVTDYNNDWILTTLDFPAFGAPWITEIPEPFQKGTAHMLRAAAGEICELP